MEKYSTYPALFFTGLSFFIILFSYRLGIGGFHAPGAGLLPFLVGLILLPISLYLLIKSIIKKEKFFEKAEEESFQTNYRKIGLVVAALFGYAILLERLGFLITTWGFLFLLFGSIGNRWISAFVTSTSTVLGAYFLFTFFGVRFPQGILRFLG